VGWTSTETFRYDSPFGEFAVSLSGETVSSLLLCHSDRIPLFPLDHPVKIALDWWFHRTSTDFLLIIDPKGTPFQKRVWAALREIPFGETRSYGEIARMIGSPAAARAVGGACRANPILLVTPCHRVTAAHGIGGFSVGVALKEKLLAFEQNHES